MVVVVQSAGRVCHDRCERRVRNQFHLVLRMVALVVVGAACLVSRAEPRRQAFASAPAGAEDQGFPFLILSRSADLRGTAGEQLAPRSLMRSSADPRWRTLPLRADLLVRSRLA